jgi:hypothetical protein
LAVTGGRFAGLQVTNVRRPLSAVRGLPKNWVHHLQRGNVDSYDRL